MKSKPYLLLGVLLVLGLLLSACAQAAAPDPNASKPSKPGGTGQALLLKGDPAKGKILFVNKCSECHGDEGKGGVANEGSEDGTVPALNPIDASLTNQDPKIFAANIDLYIEHGSVPKGDNPPRMMMGFGDLKLLEPQEIADVIAYIISLNPVK